MKNETAAVTSKEELADGIWSIWLRTSISKEAKPGQFILIFPNDASHLLGRPVCICEVNSDRTELRIVFRVAGEGTAEFSCLPYHGEVNIEGPLGNGYPVAECKGKSHIVLLGGGIGAPALLELAKAVRPYEKLTVILGYRDSSLKHFLYDDFAETGADVRIATDDGSEGTKGTVLDALVSSGIPADIIFACGPMMMLRAIGEYASLKGIKAYISLEERMACGVGACLGCVVRTKRTDGHSHVNNARICTEGPVFEAGEVIL